MDIFQQSQIEEVMALVKRVCFGFVSSQMSRSFHLYCSRVVNNIKSEGIKLSKFCVAALSDSERRLFTAAPAIKKG